MHFENLTSLDEQVAYLNGFLDAVGDLNTTPNHIMEHYIIELEIKNNDLEETLKDHLETPTWIFEFVQLDDWRQHLEVNLEDFFTYILTGLSGYNRLLQSFILDLDRCVHQFVNVQAFAVSIDSRPDYRSGYFAHDERNYVFKITDDKVLFLSFRVSD